MESLAGRRVGILGLARSGQAAGRLALARGARVYASDLADTEATRAAAAELAAQGAEVELGRHDEARLAACDFVVVSPGILPHAPIVQFLRERRRPILSELEFAFRQLRCPVVAITGTNGKTTTTAWTAHLLQAAGLRAPACGNIGRPLAEVALADPPPDVAVVEASSFQLHWTEHFAPRWGAVTNLAPDHLDWHGSFAAYAAAKARLFANADPTCAWVLPGEDAQGRALIGDAVGRRYYVYVTRPLPAAEAGAAWEGEELVLRWEDGRVERLLPRAELPVLGRHNVANALMAALLARLVGASHEVVRQALRSVTPPPHRLERVAERAGVLWIDDSKATNVASTRVALAAMDRPTVLLLGGRPKGEDFRALRDAFGPVREVIAFGEAGPQLAAALEGTVPVTVVPTLRAAVEEARRRARPGEAVLLSPACASFDEFRNYEERGERFAAWVRGEAS